MARLLVLSPTFPYPPRGGGEIRLFHLLRRLARSFEICLLSLQEGSTRDLERATGIRRALVRSAPEPAGRSRRRGFDLWRHSPHGIRLDRDPAFAASLGDVLRQGSFDAILVEHVYMLPYTTLIPAVPIFLTAHNVESLKHRRWFDGVPRPKRRVLRHWAQQRVLRRWESSLAGRTDAVFAVSTVDRDLLDRMNPGGRIVLASNGADLDYFAARSRESFDGPPALLLMGSLHYEPNRRAARELTARIFPRIRAHLPDAACHLVGSGAEVELAGLHDPASGIHVHGAVADVRPHLHRAQVTIAPLSVASGSRIKILESLASGTPVVSTRIGAEGIEGRDGVELSLADTPEGLASAALALLADREACFRRGAAGRRLVARRYSWDACARVVRDEIERVLRQRRNRTVSTR